MAVGRGCLKVPGRPSIRVTQLTPTSFSVRGPSLQALTFFRGVGFIVLNLRRPFFYKEIRRSSRHFLNRRACVGFDPATGPTLKKNMCHTCQVGGTYDKYQNSLLAPISKKDTTVFWDLIAAPTCSTARRPVSNYHSQFGRKPSNATRLLIIHYKSQWLKTRTYSFLFSDLSK